ncbi:MAG: TetR/AcrR family transcriptional regulator [Cytophagales bacterium]|nr:TetR/AcrR family transcriptional regulator [Cytophagales bacterium]
MANKNAKKKQPWIDIGYQSFAYEGPHGLKVERLADGVEKNKSSFYHYFADLEVFTNHLLRYHLAQAEVIAIKESACETIDDFIDVLVTHKIDLLFNRQLRVHRENPDFESVFCKTNEITGQAIALVWPKLIGLANHHQLAEMMLKHSIENFYLQITDETLNRPWLRQYFDDLLLLVNEFMKTGNVPAIDRTS